MGKRRLEGLLTLLAMSLAACGGGSDGPALSPPPASPPPPPPPAAIPQISVPQVFPNLIFTQPVSLQQAPADATRWFAVEQSGVIHVFPNEQGADILQTFLDISARVTAGGERGLLGMAFHPDFPATPEVYVSYTGQSGGLTSFLSRFTSADGGLTLDPASEAILLTVAQDFDNHNGGHIAFGPDGFLYLGLGDGGSGGDPNERAQDNRFLLGTIVRVDVDGGSPYAIPAGNPFATNQTCPQGVTVGGEACPEIFAWGLRNPWRFSFDRLSGTLWAGDVGQGSWEEVDIITAGGDYGWDDREGAHCFEPASGCVMDSIEPITEYPNPGSAAVTGGYVYRGSAVTDLVGWYVFGDFVSGQIFAVPADSQTGTAPTELLDTDLAIASFGESVDGELFVVDYAGTLHQVTAAP